MLLAIDGLSGTRVDKGGLLWTRLEIFGIDPSPRGPGEAGSQGEVDALAGRRDGSPRAPSAGFSVIDQLHAAPSSFARVLCCLSSLHPWACESIVFF